MNERERIIDQLREYFDIMELVCPHTHRDHDENSWQFLRTELLEVLLVVRRDIIKVPIHINNYHQGGELTQRGLRCNICGLVKEKSQKGVSYLSGHVLGAAIDFDARGFSAQYSRDLITENKLLLPHPIRFEGNVTWVHLDVYDNLSGKLISVF